MESWNGTCESSENFTCNNKIIGAKHYHIDRRPLDDGDIPSPRDSQGHGSHTSSTAAGRVVGGASLYGLGLGTARGGVPSARIAVYKMCWIAGCWDADILAAFDDAIADGVDIISISVGGSFFIDYFQDSIAIGAFHAMKHGILTSAAAGNWGNGTAGLLNNYSPWSLTVAASTVDRKFITKVHLGDKEGYVGVSINTFNLNWTLYPLVYCADGLAAGRDGNESRYCMIGSSDDPDQVTGKIVFTDDLNSWMNATDAGAIGILMHDEGPLDYGDTYSLSASVLYTKDGNKVLSYMNSTSNPTVTIEKSIAIIDKAAPYIVSFSSRGPNPITVDILKPDLSAPGVEILAAWSEATTVTGYGGDKRVVPYNIISGTSMACPHATLLEQQLMSNLLILPGSLLLSNPHLRQLQKL